jgi:hypothetical protein
MAGEKPNRPLLFSEREPGRTYDMYEASSVSDIYVDGQARIYSSPQVTKIEYFRTIGFKEEGGARVEEREIVLRLQIPTPVFIEAAGNGLSSVDLGQFDQASAQLRQLMTDVVKKVQNVKLL